jgi:hypothetical protein
MSFIKLPQLIKRRTKNVAVISGPIDTKRNLHIEYNKNTKSLIGIPADWLKQIQKLDPE